MNCPDCGHPLAEASGRDRGTWFWCSRCSRQWSNPGIHAAKLRRQLDEREKARDEAVQRWADACGIHPPREAKPS